MFGPLPGGLTRCATSLSTEESPLFFQTVERANPKTGIGLACSGGPQYEPTRQYEYAPAYSEGPVNFAGPGHSRESDR